MKRFVVLILMSLMLMPVFGCGGGGGKPAGEGELLTDNPRAAHYDMDDEEGAGTEEQTTEQQ